MRLNELMWVAAPPYLNGQSRAPQYVRTRHFVLNCCLPLKMIIEELTWVCRILWNLNQGLSKNTHKIPTLRKQHKWIKIDDAKSIRRLTARWKFSLSSCLSLSSRLRTYEGDLLMSSFKELGWGIGASPPRNSEP